jgi:hypothetical protein
MLGATRAPDHEQLRTSSRIADAIEASGSGVEAVGTNLSYAVVLGTSPIGPIRAGRQAEGSQDRSCPHSWCEVYRKVSRDRWRTIAHAKGCRRGDVREDQS